MNGSGCMDVNEFGSGCMDVNEFGSGCMDVNEFGSGCMDVNDFGSGCMDVNDFGSGCMDVNEFGSGCMDCETQLPHLSFSVSSKLLRPLCYSALSCHVCSTMPKRPANSVLSGPSPKVQRKGITIEEKIKVLVALSKGNGASSVGRQFGLSESSVRTIKKNEEKIRAAYASPDISKSKLHLKSAVYTEMESALTLWMEDMRRRKLSLSGPMVQEQAFKIQSQIAAKQGKSIEETKFTASTGWLYKYMKRTGTKNIAMTGEAASADYGAAEEMKNKMKEINYSPQQVWNCDETGLYWKRMPMRTYIMKNEEKAPGLKVSKQRLTVLLMANTAGTEQLKPLVIHRSARPRAFKNVFISKLPVIWRANKKAWMTSNIFEEWYVEYAIPGIENVNKKHNMANRAMVITDNASSHSKHLCTVSDDVKL
ncbi:hypothetical protein Pcinc_016793 [Petrolisthes cinctipes]|uniref:HTH CENPB-type domain-containing protein n=1 Tax=Petrolisthes cinctipes TaxID=88211 RepID=A0AAE1FQL2_PETCI|nr:hypothetical protein Pcinc_016793 [Petrolisthes cinctipes]